MSPKRCNWHSFISMRCTASSSPTSWRPTTRPSGCSMAARVTRSRTSQQHEQSRLDRGAPPSLWPRLPAELLGRIASACESGAELRAIDAVDCSLRSTRVERLLGALQGTPSEPLLLHVRHVARRAAPALVTAGASTAALLPTPPHHALPTPRLLRYKPDAASTPDTAAPCPGCRGGSRADQVHSRGRRPAHGWAADRLRFRHRAARRRKGMRPCCLPPLPASPSRRLRLRSARRC